MDGVESVRVHLALAPDSIFSGSEREAKASVILSMRGSRITRQTENAVARLVAGAVDKLASEDVAVIDADLSNALAKDAGSGIDANGRSLEAALSERLVQTLEPVVGVGRVRASVRMEYDLSSSEEQQESFDPTKTAPLSMQRTEERSATAAGGIAGTASNLPNGSGGTAAKPSEEGQNSRSENGTYAVSKLVRHTMVPAGRIKRVAAAVLIDDEVELKNEAGRITEVRHHRSAEQLGQIEELAKAAVGADDSRGDVVTVQNIGFQAMVREKPAPLTILKRVQNAAREWGQAIRFAAIGLLFLAIYATVLKPVKKQMLEALKAAGLRLQVMAGDARAGSVAVDAATSITLPGAPLEARQLGALKKQIVEKVKAEPLPTTRLVQTWIREGDEA
jgi:flagellar M-ring protein FliF